LWWRGKEVRLVSNGWFLANGPVVPSTRLPNGLVEPYGCDYPSKPDLERHKDW
jgi:hypothetical protein